MGKIETQAREARQRGKLNLCYGLEMGTLARNVLEDKRKPERFLKPNSKAVGFLQEAKSELPRGQLGLPLWHACIHSFKEYLFTECSHSQSSCPEELSLERGDGRQDVSDLSKIGKSLWVPGTQMRMGVEVNRKEQEEGGFCPGGGTMVLGQLSLGWGRARTPAERGHRLFCCPFMALTACQAPSTS